MGYFAFRIDQLKIFKNREVFRAEIEIMSFVSTEINVGLPNLSELNSTTDQVKQRAMVKEAALAVAQSRIFTRVENVRDNHKFFFGDTGYSLYEDKKIPEQLHWCLLVYEDDRDINRAGEYIDAVLDNTDFTTITGQLVSLAAKSNPMASLYFEIAKFITSGVAKQLKKNRDDQVGVLYQSFNKYQHYPHGIRTKQDVHDMTGNMRVDYSMYGHNWKLISPKEMNVRCNRVYRAVDSFEELSSLFDWRWKKNKRNPAILANKILEGIGKALGRYSASRLIAGFWAPGGTFSIMIPEKKISA